MAVWHRRASGSDTVHSKRSCEVGVCTDSVPRGPFGIPELVERHTVTGPERIMAGEMVEGHAL